MGGLLALVAQAADVRVNLSIPGILALIAGILLLVWPRLLRFIVAGYLILVGLVEVFNVRI